LLPKKARSAGTGSAPTSAAHGRRGSPRAKRLAKGSPRSPPPPSTAPWRRSLPGRTPRTQPVPRPAGDCGPCVLGSPERLVQVAGRHVLERSSKVVTRSAPSPEAAPVATAGPLCQAAMGPWSGALRAERSSRPPSGAVPKCPAALSASRPRTGRPWKAAAPWWEGRASGSPSTRPGPVGHGAREVQIAPHVLPGALPPPSVTPRPAGRRAGTSPAARTAGPGHMGLSGEGPRGGAQGPATEAPAGSSPRTWYLPWPPSQVPGRPGRAPVSGLPVSDAHPLWRVEVPAPDRRPDLDPFGQRLHDPTTVLNVEVVPSCL